MADPTQLSDAERLKRWAAEHGHAIRGFLMAMVRRSDVADDLLQEVFYRAWRAKDQYVESGSSRGYLLQIADRLVCDLGRKKRLETNVDEHHWKLIEPRDESTDPTESLAREEAGKKLSAAMEHLSKAQSRVLLLRYYGEFDFSKIAEITEMPLNTVLSHCRNGSP